jgi:hypothetical protein
MTRTSAYRFTVRMVNGQVAPEDQAAVDGLRTVVKLGNTAFGTTQYVKLQGRGHRRGVYHYNQSLPLLYATSADVYVYTRNR